MYGHCQKMKLEDVFVSKSALSIQDFLEEKYYGKPKVFFIFLNVKI